MATSNAESGSSPRLVSQIDISSGTIIVPGSYEHKINAAIEDTRLSIIDEDFASHFLESIEKLYNGIDDSMNNYIGENTVATDSSQHISTGDEHFTGSKLVLTITMKPSQLQ